MTIPDSNAGMATVKQYDWSSIATSQRCGMAELASRVEDTPIVLGIRSGTLSILAREVRKDGRLGPPIPLAEGMEGDLLVVPAGGDGLRIKIWADNELEAVVLQPERSADQVIDNPASLFGRQLGNQREIEAWLDELREQSERPLTWKELFKALPLRARARAEAMVSTERVEFAMQLGRSVAVSKDMLDIAVQGAVASDQMRSVKKLTLGINPLDSACRLVAESVGAHVPDRIHYDQDSPLTFLEQFTRSTHLHRRTVLLQGHWWSDEAGPMLTFRRSDHAPIALLPARKGYKAHVCTDAGTETVRVDAAFASTLEDHSEMFYAALPARAITLRDILAFVLRGNGRDALVMLLATLVTSLMVACVPIITGIVVDTIIPGVQLNALLFVGLLLLGVAFSRTLLHVVGGFAFLRIETRSSFALMAAFIDRLLQLPATFYRGRSAGDMTQRVMAIEQIRSSLTQSVLSVSMSFFAGLSNLVVLFFYDLEMAFWGIGLALLQIAFIGFISIYLARRNYELSVEKGKLDGMSLDVLNGIRQARVQGSLQRVLARVMDGLTPVAQASYRIGIIRDVNRAVLMSFSGLVLIVVFVMFTMRLDSGGASPMSDGGFVAFVTALSAFFGAMAMLGPAISSIAEAIPQYHRLKPIMDAKPEVLDTSELKSHVLRGGVGIRNAVFRYGDGLPAILNGVTIDVRSGEYVAIVGRTGCGKSTLLSMLLGLEQPESGSVLYDDTPLENMDPSIVRSQVGVVMQSNSLLPGSIKSTILGVGSDRTVDDAWDASRLVGMEDEISELPMGMLTFVGSTTISSSQSQRLLIARALVGRPNILFLDEATSALDNHSQSDIASSIDRLGCTRVVIAHRLSTIRNADRIYVLKEGKIVENGTFEELASADGHFSELMAGQLE
jgi:NHLM bacteriocin system ABC transporter ATP-binding protein